MALKQLQAVKTASKQISLLTNEQKNTILKNLMKQLDISRKAILDANRIDLKNAIDLSDAMKERLTLNDQRIDNMIQQVKIVLELPEPNNKLLETINRPNGLIIDKVSVPLGVVAIIYESRPNVTIDVAALCLKSGNACVLKGGKEAINTNQVLVDVVHQAMKDIVCTDSIYLLDSSSQVLELIKSNQFVDVVVPRGGKGLIDFVVNNATVPVIETGAGVCHLYIDEECDIEMAINIAINAKVSRPSVCNSIETILVHVKQAAVILPQLQEKMLKLNTILKGDNSVTPYINVEQISEDDYYIEYNDYIANVKVVNSVIEAIDHIEKHSTKHSETIISTNDANINLFTSQISSACVYVNASTRFSDGGEFGFGLELGISTQKLHARGPIGLQQLTSYKYIIKGNGQVRE